MAVADLEPTVAAIAVAQVGAKRAGGGAEVETTDGGPGAPLADPLDWAAAAYVRREAGMGEEASAAQSAAARSGSPTAASPAVDDTFWLVGHGTPKHPDAGLLWGNGFSWDATTCTGGMVCHGGSAGWFGDGGDGFNGGNGGHAGQFFGNGGNGGAGSAAVTPGETGGDGGIGGNAGLFGGNGGAGGAGGAGADGVDGNDAGAPGVPGTDGTAGGHGGQGGRGGAGSFWSGRGGDGGAGGDAGAGGRGGDGADGDAVTPDGGKGGAAGAAGVAGTGGAGGTGGTRGADGADGAAVPKPARNGRDGAGYTPPVSPPPVNPPPVSPPPVNTRPVARDDAFGTIVGTPVVGNVLANDTDIDADALTATLGSGAARGIVNLNPNGTFTYTPAADFHGGDAFTYFASDGTATSALATVTLTVTPLNDPHEPGTAIPPLGALADGRTLMLVGQTFEQEYTDFIEGTGLTPAGSSHYSTFYWGVIEQGDDGPNAEFLDYIRENDLGDYAMVALSLKDNTPAGGYGQMINPNAADYNSNAVWEALDDIRNGTWDAQIDSFAQIIASRPDTQFLLRIGYEVGIPLFAYNGDQYINDWLNEKAGAGINVFDNPDAYPELDRTAFVDAYNRIADRIESQAGNVEFGYHPVRGLNDTRWLYPGQENVDWIGFSVFNHDVGMEAYGVTNAPGQRIDPNLALSMDFAQAQGHQIVIAESTAQNPAASDPNLFIEYLDRLDDVVEQYDVSALAYINSDWNAHGWGPEWGDSRVEVKPAVENFFLDTFGADTRYVYSDTSTRPTPAPPTPTPPAPEPPATPGTGLTAADRAYWAAERGVGFSVGSLGALESQPRLEDALQEVVDLGFSMVRTWGTDEYTVRMLEAITRLDLPLKVQPGIYITGDADARGQIDSALSIIAAYEDKVLGVSLGNEQLADWNPSATLTASEVIGQVDYFKTVSSLPVTYDFSAPTLLPGSSQWGHNLAGLVQELDYVSVHDYGGFFENRNNPGWTPELQLASVRSYEAMLADTLVSLGAGSKPIILGETGWQSTGYHPTVTNPANMARYYELISRYLYGPDARFDGMYYFNFTDEAWKGGDDHWGLFREGTASEIGASKFAIASVPEILAGDSPTPGPEPEQPGVPAPAGSFPVSLINDTGGAFGDDEIFLTIFGQAPRGTWAWVDKAGVAHALDHTAANAPGHLEKDGVNYANMSFSLAQAAGLRIPPEIQGTRMYVSMAQPLFIGISPDNSGWAGPDPAYHLDPNYGTVYDYFELTYDHGQVPFGANTTQVDQFAVPIKFTLEQAASGFSATRGLNVRRSEVFDSFVQDLPAAFQPLLINDAEGNPLRFLSPRTRQPGELAGWLDEPVNDFWEKYTHEAFAHNGPGYTVNGRINASSQLFEYTVTPSGGAPTAHTMAKPTTAEVFAADGPFAGAGLQVLFLAELDAALNRGVASTPELWNTVAAYYPEGQRWNNYAKLFHDIGLERLAYGFPYDDINDQSSVLILLNAEPADELRISIGY